MVPSHPSDDHAAAQDRVCLLVDVDSFDVQVLQKYLYPETVGKPCIVHHSRDPDHRLGALNYEAKSLGIFRDDSLRKALLKCPTVCQLTFPRQTDTKCDTSLQKEATRELLTAAVEFCNQYDKDIRPVLEYSSCDEFYLDVTRLVHASKSLEKSPSLVQLNPSHKHIVETSEGPISFDADPLSQLEDLKLDEKEMRLFHGLVIGAKLVNHIKNGTGYDTSVGVGWNKLIAKLACGLNKPLALTLILPAGLGQASRKIPMQQIPGLGGKIGKIIMNKLSTTDKTDHQGVDDDLKPVKCMADLLPFSLEELASIVVEGYVDNGIQLGRQRTDAEAKKIGTKKAEDIYNAVRGLDNHIVNDRLGPKDVQPVQVTH